MPALDCILHGVARPDLACVLIIPGKKKDEVSIKCSRLPTAPSPSLSLAFDVCWLLEFPLSGKIMRLVLLMMMRED